MICAVALRPHNAVSQLLLAAVAILGTSEDCNSATSTFQTANSLFESDTSRAVRPMSFCCPTLTECDRHRCINLPSLRVHACATRTQISGTRFTGQSRVISHVNVKCLIRVRQTQPHRACYRAIPVCSYELRSHQNRVLVACLCAGPTRSQQHARCV